MITDLIPLLTQQQQQQQQGFMFKEDTQFIVHAADKPCPQDNQQEEEEEDEETFPTEHLEELLDEFPWGNRAKRLLHCILQQLDSVPEDYAIIDLLKFCCTPENKFDKSDGSHRRKIIATLKKFKAGGMNIPQAFLTRACVKKMF
jgi:hypothetical protein